MDFSVGQVIFSKAGRDKRRPFIVLKTESDYLFLTDGKTRLVNKPKKKKVMHVQPTNIIKEEIQDIIRSGVELKDSDIRRALADFLLNAPK